MNNSKWKPYSEIPDEGTFLVYAPNRENGRAPFFRSNNAICYRYKNIQGHVMCVINGHFDWDMPTPTLYADIDDLVAQLPIAATESENY